MHFTEYITDKKKVGYEKINDNPTFNTALTGATEVVEAFYSVQRDPKHNQELLNLVAEIWSKTPDLHFNQLLYNLQEDYSNKNNKYGQVNELKSDCTSYTAYNFCDLEDDKFIEFLRSLITDR